MKAYQHIIWDWNGTLLDDVRLCIDVVNHILVKRGKQAITEETYKETFDFPVLDYYTRIGFDFSQESFDQLCDEYTESYVNRVSECALQNGAQQALCAVQNAGIGQSILSAAEQSQLEAAVDSFGARHLFTKLVGLQNRYAASKVENGKALLNQLNLLKEEVLLVGDTVHDYEVAKSMGIDCVLLSNGHHPESKLQACGVPVIDSLAALPELIGAAEAAAAGC